MTRLRPRRTREQLRPLPRWLRIIVAATYPLCALLAVAGLALTVLWGWSLSSVYAANDRHFGRAVAGFSDQRDLTRVWPEPWRAPYNIGTARVEGGRLTEGIAELHEAFALVGREPRVRPDQTISPHSPECLVRINLSIGLEKLGDTRATNGDAASARTLYRQAADMSQPCTGSDSSHSGSAEPDSPSERAKDAHDRQSAKAGDSPTEAPSRNPSSQPTPSPSSTPPDAGAEAERRKELSDRNRDAREQRDRGPRNVPNPSLPPGRYW